MSTPKRQAQKNTGTKSEAKKVVQKVRKERDEACVREEALRERLKVVETVSRTQLRELRDKLKYVNAENKELNLVLSKLRPGLEPEAGLRARAGREPGLGNRAAREALKELQERAVQCWILQEENGRCSERMRALSRDLAEVASARQALQEQLQAARDEL
ncbi:uncharacterized protein zgc:113691 [Callorhinchus milii]|uniref:uncharacterized protein zgc:113691 n=1 Tax=Callorhinchus milii TaxID=7868 RepID=UPI00045732CA|nr:uncharacterized protein zgc:113691 [Callorhinchus milii]|eukprot:gi/632991807/ref/XP_007884795.1/ PREDICTED: coiled-coil domain-containing protein 88B-like [Callorhinchus milii]